MTDAANNSRVAFGFTEHTQKNTHKTWKIRVDAFHSDPKYAQHLEICQIINNGRAVGRKILGLQNRPIFTLSLAPTILNTPPNLQRKRTPTPPKKN